MRHRLIASAVCLIALGAVNQPRSPAAEPAVDITWGVKIPVRDGYTLNATVYRPAGQAMPLPAVVTITPYVSDTYHDRGMYFARRGYVFAIVDVRGRGNSEGVFEPFT